MAYGLRSALLHSSPASKTRSNRSAPCWHGLDRSARLALVEHALRATNDNANGHVPLAL